MKTPRRLILFFKALDGSRVRRFKGQPGYALYTHRWHSMMPDGERGGGGDGSPVSLSPFQPDPLQAETFRRDLNRALVNRRSNVDAIPVGNTPTLLRALGAPALPITISRDVVRKATNGVKHSVPMAVVRQLPELLADPVMVFASAPHPERKNRKVEKSSLVVLMDAIDEQGAPIIAAVHLRQYEKRHEVNRIASVYGKDQAEVIGSWIRQGLLRYRHTQKSLAWFQSRGLQLPKEGTTQGLIAGKIILTDADLVNPVPLAKAMHLPSAPRILFFKAA